VVAGLVSLVAGAYGLNLVVPQTAPSPSSALNDRRQSTATEPTPNITIEKIESPKMTLIKNVDDKVIPARATETLPEPDKLPLPEMPKPGTPTDSGRSPEPKDWDALMQAKAETPKTTGVPIPPPSVADLKPLPKPSELPPASTMLPLPFPPKLETVPTATPTELPKPNEKIDRLPPPLDVPAKPEPKASKPDDFVPSAPKEIVPPPAKLPEPALPEPKPVLLPVSKPEDKFGGELTKNKPLPEPVGSPFKEAPVTETFTMTKPPAVVAPSIPTTPATPSATSNDPAPKTDYDVDIIRVRGGDTYSSIARANYDDERLGTALQQYNRGLELRQVREIEVPPLHVLKKQFPTKLQSVRDSGTPEVRGPVIDAAVPTEKKESLDWDRPGQKRNRVTMETYTTKQDGLTARQVARVIFGDEREWTKLTDAKGQPFGEEEGLPKGTAIRYPREELGWK